MCDKVERDKIDSSWIDSVRLEADRTEMLGQLYECISEDDRLTASQQGRLEYITTMSYIHDYLCDGASILEIGAGTGRYSIALARAGYNVTAIELLEHNLEILRRNSTDLDNIEARQGDALDLSEIEDDTYDMTLLFGPMYHLYDAEDQHKAIDEAIRVTRPGGTIMVAFLSAYAIMYTNYLYSGFKEGMAENFTDSWDVRHFKEQVFTGFDITEFEELFTDKPVKWLKTVSADSVLEYGRRWSQLEMDEEEFEAYVRFHLATCEIRELLGGSSHLLYICSKTEEV